MIKTTRAQREALFKVFQREFPSWISPNRRRRSDTGEIVPVPTTQYRKFLAKRQPFFGGDCVMIPYAGMWLGIEKDGYTHSLEGVVIKTVNLNPNSWHDTTDYVTALHKEIDRLKDENNKLKDYYVAFKKEEARADLLAAKIEKMTELFHRIQDIEEGKKR
jgi:hypothetical protein